jgi:hypothetical protein
MFGRDLGHHSEEQDRPRDYWHARAPGTEEAGAGSEAEKIYRATAPYRRSAPCPSPGHELEARDHSLPHRRLGDFFIFPTPCLWRKRSDQFDFLTADAHGSPKYPESDEATARETMRREFAFRPRTVQPEFVARWGFTLRASCLRREVELIVMGVKIGRRCYAGTCRGQSPLR